MNDCSGTFFQIRPRPGSMVRHRIQTMNHSHKGFWTFSLPSENHPSTFVNVDTKSLMLVVSSVKPRGEFYSWCLCLRPDVGVCWVIARELDEV